MQSGNLETVNSLLEGKIMRKVLFLLLIGVNFSLKAEADTEKVFTEIYKKGIWSWGVEGHSGSGSELHNAIDYVNFLQSFLKNREIRNVVDLGCGDWRFSQYIDWSGIEYFGYDVVAYLVDRNQKSYGKPGINFLHIDGADTPLQEADLLVCKDVLQHLPNHEIKRILEQLPKFKYCLITNDVDPMTLTANNEDIEVGGYRNVDLTQPPFNIKGLKVLNYRSQYVVKQVLLIERE